MTQPVFPPLEMGKDVLLGILPFYHIFGRSLSILVLQGEPEDANYRGGTVASLYANGRVVCRDHATVRT